jgi:hypothetical protein
VPRAPLSLEPTEDRRERALDQVSLVAVEQVGRQQRSALETS